MDAKIAGLIKDIATDVTGQILINAQIRARAHRGISFLEEHAATAALQGRIAEATASGAALIVTRI